MYFSLMTDRKSTRLNSSHSQISYAVFCLKKKIAQSVVPSRERGALRRRRYRCRGADAGVGEALRGLEGRQTAVELAALACEDSGTRRHSETLIDAKKHLVFTIPALLSSNDQTAAEYARVCSDGLTVDYYVTYQYSVHVVTTEPVAKSFFFFNNPAPTEIFPLPPPAPLPI